MGKMGSTKITDRTEVSTPDAVQLFTDRENPQEAFERKFRVLNNYRTEVSCVLCYYGIGGIGKTSLLNRLCHVLDGDPASPRRLLNDMDSYHITFDFGAEGVSSDKRSVLTSLRNQLVAKDPGFRFYLFDTALVLYAKKIGADVAQDSSTSLILNQNPWLNSAVTAVGALPVIGWVSNTLQAIDTFAAAVKDKRKEQLDKAKHENYLRQMYYYEASELLDHLHEYFIQDMYSNMVYYAQKPLVVFLDTYEKYIDTMNSDAISIVNDYWLRKGPGSVIQSIPGIMWVIMGRERLSWAEDDPFWGEDVPERPLDAMSEEEKDELAEELLEQHLLGDLSEKDALSFLQKAGFRDEELGREIYQKLTKGTPLFLDICVRQYETISKTKKPEFSDFGSDLDELVNRYLFYMPAYYKELAYFLALIGNWTDEMVELLAPKVPELKGYSKTRYQEFMKHSFVIRGEDGYCYLHETVKKACLIGADDEMAQSVSTAKATLIEATYDFDNDLEYIDNMDRYVSNLFAPGVSFEKAYGAWDKLREFVTILLKKSDYQGFYRIAKHIHSAVEEFFPGTGLEFISKAFLADAVRRNGEYKAAEEMVHNYLELPRPEDISEKDYYDAISRVANCFYSKEMPLEAVKADDMAYHGLLSVLGPDHDLTLQAEQSYAVSLRMAGRQKESLEISQDNYDRRVRMNGEKSDEAQTALVVLGNAFSAAGDYQKSLELLLRSFELAKELLGEEHPHTIAAKSALAGAYTRVGEYQKAFEIDQQVYEFRKTVFGEDHPLTVSSISGLASDLLDLGKYREALVKYQEVYDYRCRTVGKSNLATMKALHSLSIAYYRLSEYHKAYELDKEVYATRCMLLGEKHPSTINSLSALAADLNTLGEYTKALEKYKQAYELRCEVMGEKQPHTITALAGIASATYNLGHYGEALSIYRQVYELRCEVLGTEHLSAVDTLINIANCCSEMGNYATAYEERKKVLEYRTRVLGEMHPKTIFAKASVASTLLDMGHASESLKLYLEVYDQRLEVLGEDHDTTVGTMISIGICYTKLGEYQKAKECDEKVYEYRKKKFGDKHPDTLIALVNLSVDCNNVGEYETALEYDKYVYEVRLKNLGAEHPDTILSLNNLAVAYDRVGNSAKCRELTKEAYELRKKVLGVNHPLTLTTLSNMAHDYYMIGDLETALELYRQLYEGRLESLGEDHPETVAAMDRYAIVLQKVGEWYKSYALFEKVLVMQKKVLGENHREARQTELHLAKMRANYDMMKERFPFF